MIEPVSVKVFLFKCPDGKGPMTMTLPREGSKRTEGDDSVYENEEEEEEEEETLVLVKKWK